MLPCPITKIAELELLFRPELHRRADPFAPLRILNANDRALCDRRMQPQDLFDLQRRDFLRTALDDVDVLTSEQAVGPILYDRGIACVEPAVVKCCLGFLW